MRAATVVRGSGGPQRGGGTVLSRPAILEATSTRGSGGPQRFALASAPVACAATSAASTLVGLTSGGDAASSVGSWRGRSGSAWTAVATVASAPASVGLDAPAVVEAVADVELGGLAHAGACLAAASLESKGVPHAQPAENLSRKAVRRCRESLWRLSAAKLPAVNTHSVQSNRDALCAYTARTEAG
ncbi:hypothetical protein Pcac1_g28381 [Phytophthora cactorum]|nr:hypothetical protein Pcac1_g28340 [Phytophthora cactorum]KAG2759631.1 hypothetical protein Pcac1_g28381 [Phytophthora cactorum]